MRGHGAFVESLARRGNGELPRRAREPSATVAMTWLLAGLRISRVAPSDGRASIAPLMNRLAVLMVRLFSEFRFMSAENQRS